jgi:antirestriction protein ArdC
MGRNKEKNVMSKVYGIVNEKILDAMSKGIVPWVKPWFTVANQNPITGTKYSGINVWLTALHNIEHDLTSNLFLTKNQINKMGGSIKKGEKSCMVTFFKKMPKKDEPEKTIPVFMYYHVWNVEQTTIQLAFEKKIPDYGVFEYENGYTDGPKVIYREQDAAYYSPTLDEIAIPNRHNFKKDSEFQHTVFHELVHSTGHKTRLDRKLATDGGKDYAREELIAEIGAAYLQHINGVNIDFLNTASYIDSWKKRAEDDSTLFVKAASAAEKAVNFIQEKGAAKKVDLAS